MGQVLLLHMVRKQFGDIKPGKIAVASAGLYTSDGSPATREAIQVMAEKSLDLSGHRSRQICHEIVDWADLVLTMNARQCQELKEGFPNFKGMIYSLGEFAGQNDIEIKDPLGWGIAAYQECARELQKLLELALKRLMREYEL
jgi:protein-tyrosine-phosphatase